MQADLGWWQAVLSRQGISWSLLPHLHLDPNIWVDAFMSWAIGLVVKGCWAAWMLLEGWKAKDHDIDWAETVTMELALLYVVVAGFCDVKVIIHGDNTRVLGALNKGRLQNMASNLSICQMVWTMVPDNVMVEPIYVTSETNLADACSSGMLGSADTHLPVLFTVPMALNPFIRNV